MNKEIWDYNFLLNTLTVVKEEITSFYILERLVLQFTFEFLLRTQMALVHPLYLEAWTPINTWESWFRFLDPVLPTASRTDFVTCWHAKTDGWAASTFHGNCDGRGPTVTIIKVNEYIFGGYTDVSWSGGTHIKFLMRGQDNFIGSTIILLEFKGGRELEEILNDAPLIIALNLYYFMIVFWPSRFIHTYIVYRNFPIWYTCRTTLHPKTSSNNNTLTKGVICFKSQNFLLAFLQRKPLNLP